MILLLFSTEVLGHLITGPLRATPERSQVRGVKSLWGIEKERTKLLNVYAFVSWQLRGNEIICKYLKDTNSEEDLFSMIYNWAEGSTDRD